MVWGMYLPSTGGAFGPYGKEEGTGAGINMKSGWGDRLQAHYQSQSPEIGQAMWGDDWNSPDNIVDYSHKVVKKFQYEIGRKTLGDPWEIAAPIQPHEPPSYYLTEKSFAQLGSIISLTDRKWAMDEAAKSVIEELEPGLHQFYRLDIRMPRNQTYPVPFYTFVCGQWLESFSPQDTMPGSFKEYNSNGITWYQFFESKAVISGLAMRKSVFKGAHCWRERGFNEKLVCFSDEAISRRNEAGCILPKHYRMNEV